MCWDDRIVVDSFYGLRLKPATTWRAAPAEEMVPLSDGLFGTRCRFELLCKNEADSGELTIRYKDTLVYKYGGSDVSYNRLGGMHLLYWNSIQDAKRWDYVF